MSKILQKEEVKDKREIAESWEIVKYLKCYSTWVNGERVYLSNETMHGDEVVTSS